MVRFHENELQGTDLPRCEFIEMPGKVYREDQGDFPGYQDYTKNGMKYMPTSGSSQAKGMLLKDYLEHLDDAEEVEAAVLSDDEEERKTKVAGGTGLRARHYEIEEQKFGLKSSMVVGPQFGQQNLSD